MDLFDTKESTPHPERSVIPSSDIDLALSAQIIVAWAGEGGEEPRMGWWRSDLVSHYGGEDLFRRLLPSTWPWAVLQAARETARRHDTNRRRQDHDPDRVLTLYSLGYDLDERLNERLRDLKSSGREPHDALPALRLVAEGWKKSHFLDWISAHGEAKTTPGPIGRLVDGAPPNTLDAKVRRLVAGLAPATDSYPLPHFRRGA